MPYRRATERASRTASLIQPWVEPDMSTVPPSRPRAALAESDQVDVQGPVQGLGPEVGHARPEQREVVRPVVQPRDRLRQEQHLAVGPGGVARLDRKQRAG